MTKLIEKDDPLWFGQTCNKPYDRHHYQICFSNGSSKTVESWDEVQEFWWDYGWPDKPVIKVIDKPKLKSKGFA